MKKLELKATEENIIESLENDIDRRYINKLKRRKLLMTCGVVHKKYIYFDNEFSKKMRLANTEDKVKEIMGEFEESYNLYKKYNYKRKEN